MTTAQSLSGCQLVICIKDKTSITCMFKLYGKERSLKKCQSVPEMEFNLQVIILV